MGAFRHSLVKAKTDNKKSQLIESCIVRVATPIPHEELYDAERAVVYAYALRFGEPPPLNSTLPGRWTKAPNIMALKWAERVLGLPNTKNSNVNTM